MNDKTINHEHLLRQGLDAVDVRILTRLQVDGRASHAQLAEVAHLSAPQCFRRVKRLEEAGIVTGYGAWLDRERVGLGVLAFVSVTLGGGRAQDLDRFREVVAGMPEILECHVVTGEADFLLKVVAANLHTFSTFLLERLTQNFESVTTRSEVSLEEIKSTNALPLLPSPP